MYILVSDTNTTIMTGSIGDVLQEQYVRTLRDEDTRIIKADKA